MVTTFYFADDPKHTSKQFEFLFPRGHIWMTHTESDIQLKLGSFMPERRLTNADIVNLTPSFLNLLHLES